jgi:hypothetical protein
MIRPARSASLLVAFALLASACARSGPVSATDNSSAQGGLAVIDRTPIVNPMPTPPSSRRDVLVGSRWLLRSIAGRQLVPPPIIVGPPCALLLDDCEFRITFEKLSSGKIRMSGQVWHPNGVIAKAFNSEDEETLWLFKGDGDVGGQGPFRPGMVLIPQGGKWVLSADEERLILDPNRPSEMTLRIESFGPQSFKLTAFTITGEIEIELVRP